MQAAGSHSELDRYFFSQEDVLDITSNQTEFAHLKETLKQKGAITNEVIRQRLHVYFHNRKKVKQQSTAAANRVHIRMNQSTRFQHKRCRND